MANYQDLFVPSFVLNKLKKKTTRILETRKVTHGTEKINENDKSKSPKI